MSADTELESRDVYWMSHALVLAERAARDGEVPVGAVVVKDGRILGEGCNGPVAAHDPCAHAEIEALRRAGAAEHNYRLAGATLYVTLEPCAMCAGALVHARIERLVFGAHDPKSGVICSVMSLLEAPHFNHRVRWRGGVLEEECGERLRAFFKDRREGRGAD